MPTGKPPKILLEGEAAAGHGDDPRDPASEAEENLVISADEGVKEAGSSPAADLNAAASATADIASAAADRFVSETEAASETASAAIGFGNGRAEPSDEASRPAAALEVPQLWMQFMERQARRTVDGATGLARCRNLTDFVDLQRRLVADSVGDFLGSHVEIARRSVGAITSPARLFRDMRSGQ
jgi:hypothetical protein